jgi:hypothetical protein
VNRFSKSLRLTTVVLMLIIAPQRLPAPIQEVPESPTPAPAIAPTGTPKSKPSQQRKPKPEASESTKNSVKQQPTPKSRSFAGKWVGTMPEVPWGNVATELIVDQTETMMDWQESGKKKGRSKTTLNGNTLQASFQVGVTAKWSLTPQPGGATAHVRLQAFMNDQTAIFHRTPAALKTSAPSR